MAFAGVRMSPLRSPTSTILLMEQKQPVEAKRIFHHYDHTDLCRHARWTARECFEYMYARPWESVNRFYSELVSGRSSMGQLLGSVERHGNDVGDFVGSSDEYMLSAEQAKDQQGKWARVTFKIVISYLGKSFDGWQKQPELDTVQGFVERSLGRFVDDMKAEQLKDRGLPVEGLASVAGRTDKGVTALNQVCSFYTWRKDIQAQEVKDAINSAAPGRIRAVSVTRVSRAFHPNFCAKWRKYVYIFPFSEREGGAESQLAEEAEETLEHRHALEENTEQLVNSEDELGESKDKPTTFSITRVNQLLQQLEGKLLSYRMFARDTKASRNVGPPTECFIYHARAAEARLPCLDHTRGTKIMCVELVANRFLRKMVRVLVATAIREAAAGAEVDVLIQLTEATCRRATAPPAPPDGLCLVDVGYDEFDPKVCYMR